MGRCFGPLFWRKRPGASPGACYLSSRSMTAARARTQLGGGGCRPFAIGSSGSISGGRMASSTASRPGIRRGRATTRMTRRLSQHLKKVPDILATIAATSGKPLELWFQDEARIGQKNKVTRRWAERGTRPFALKDQRTASAYIFVALSRARQGGRSRPPILQHRGHDAPPPGDRRRRRARRSRRSVCGSGRMPCHREAGRARKHYARPPTVQVTRAQSRREHLAIHAR